MNKEQQLREAIIKAVPEIMELKLGCKVKDIFGKDCRYCGHRTDDESEHREFQVLDYDGILGEIEENDFNGVIIGRPITLADVLRAIDKTDLTKTKQYVEEKWTMPEFAGHIVLKLIDMWDLTKDYDNQPQPVKDFLYNLLVEHE